MSGNYDRIARFYDVDMARNMAFDDVALYARLCTERGGRVLELGCGTGRILLALLREGIDIVGIDASAGMLRELRLRADAQALDARLGRMDVRKLGFARVFDVVLCPYSLVTYLTADADVAGMLREARSVLRPEGCLVVDAFVPRPVTEHADFHPDYLRPFGAHFLARSKRITKLGPRLNRIERRYQVRSGHDEILEEIDVVEEIRPFQPDELVDTVTHAGFAIEQKLWDYGSSSQTGREAQFFTVVASATA